MSDEYSLLGREVTWTPSGILQQRAQASYGRDGWWVERVAARLPHAVERPGPYCRLVRLDRDGRPLAMGAVWVHAALVQPLQGPMPTLAAPLGGGAGYAPADEYWALIGRSISGRSRVDADLR